MRWSIVALAAPVLHSTLSAASSLTPPALPLFVRNPYFSTWLGHAREVPWTSWPIFYTGEHIGFSVMAQVPSTGNVYPLLGRPHDSLDKSGRDGYTVSYADYKGVEFDASTTNLTYSIPGAEIMLSFLSPITPTSTLRQSIPASYFTISVTGNVDINVYADINGQWVSGNRGSRIVWDYDSVTTKDPEGSNSTKKLKRWRFKRETEMLLSEFGDHAEWGTLHFVGPDHVYHEAGTSAILRQQFAKKGLLRNAVDNKFRSIMDEEPVFAFAKSFALGSDGMSGYDSVRFSVALIQDPVVQFASARGLTHMRPLWKAWFQTEDELLSFHYFDFESASKLASNYSQQLAIDAYKSGAEDYVDIVALSARQVLGATTFSGTEENPILFLKEISSNGNFQTIDVIFPSFPFFMYTNPRWLAYLLEPLIEHMLSGQYPNTYAMHDLGTHFPNATGHPDGRDEYMPVEECGNMLIMGLALVNSLRHSEPEEPDSLWVVGNQPAAESVFFEEPLFPIRLRTVEGIDKQDGPWGGSGGSTLARKWVQRSYRLWKQWTGYLVADALEPHNQLCTDDFAGWLALQTNLALKGIIGIKAMSQLAEVAGERRDASHYKEIADTYISKWEEYGMSRDGTHAKLAYNWYGSWTTLYNLFADAQLCFHLEKSDDEIIANGDGQTPIGGGRGGFVPKYIYQAQSTWYYYVRQKYGLPLDSRHLYTKTDWEFFSMAIASNQTRREILESVARWVNETATDRPLTDLHDTEHDGNYPGFYFFARPVVGGHFAFLSLQRACRGKAMDGLSFLHDVDAEDDKLAALAAEEFTVYTRGQRGGEL